MGIGGMGWWKCNEREKMNEGMKEWGSENFVELAAKNTSCKPYAIVFDKICKEVRFQVFLIKSP